MPDAMDMDEVFRAMADSSRRRILSALCKKPQVAGELGRLVGLAPNAVSFHLKWLKAAGLITSTREGKYLRYQANGALLAGWKTHVTSAFPEITESASPSRKKSAGRPTPKPMQSAPTTDDETDFGEVDEDTLPTELL